MTLFGEGSEQLQLGWLVGWLVVYWFVCSFQCAVATTTNQWSKFAKIAAPKQEQQKNNKLAIIGCSSKISLYYLLPLSVCRRGKYSSSSSIKAFSPARPETDIISCFWASDVAFSILKKCLNPNHPHELLLLEESKQVCYSSYCSQQQERTDPTLPLSCCIPWYSYLVSQKQQVSFFFLHVRTYLYYEQLSFIFRL